MEGLGSAACTARPVVFDHCAHAQSLYWLRTSCDFAARDQSLAECWILHRCGPTLHSGGGSFSLLPNAGSAHRPEPTTNRCGRALAAKGRTAGADAARAFGSVARPSATVAVVEVRVFESRLLKAR